MCSKCATSWGACGCPKASDSITQCGCEKGVYCAVCEHYPKSGESATRAADDRTDGERSDRA